MNNTNFRIRPYSKRELARLYFPDTVNEESAIANLRNLMKHNPHLIAELKAVIKIFDELLEDIDLEV